MFRRLLPVAAVIVAAALLASPASALVSVEGSGEPMFTRTTTNTVFFRFQGDNFTTYRLHYRYIVLGNNTPVYEEASPNKGNPGSTVGFADWTGLPGNAYNTLQQGSTYSICTQGETQDLFPPNWTAPTSNSTCNFAETKSVGTTIDTTPPSISVSVSGSDQYTKTVPVPVVINYNDDLSFPYAANFICSRTGMDPAAAKAACDAPGAPPKYNYNANCSVPVNGTTLPSAKVNQFNCSVTDTPTLPDGPVTVCAISANSSLPDVPGNANQITAADTAGLSPSQCGFVNVDRTAPQLSFTAPASAKVGDLVSTAGTVTDAGSGAGPTVTWNWGDNTQASTGSSPTHTYTGAGTYTITMSSQDAVGNAASAQKTITVAAVPTGGGGGTPGTGTPGTGTPGGGTSTGGGGTVSQPPTAQQIAQQVGATGGAGATQTTSAGALDVLTAKKVTITKRLKTLPLALTADVPGAAEFALVLGGRIVSKAGLRVTKAGSLGFKLKLPKKLKAGRYGLKITFTPTGGAKASTKTIKITFSTPKKKANAKHARSASSSAPALGNVPPAAMPDGGPATAPRPGGGISAR